MQFEVCVEPAEVAASLVSGGHPVRRDKFRTLAGGASRFPMRPHFFYFRGTVTEEAFPVSPTGDVVSSEFKECAMLTITSYGEGQCIWCRAHGEGVQANFKDGLTGFLCRKHFWEALKVRSNTIETKETSHAEPVSRKVQ